MSFLSGRVSFCRFRVVGDAPETVDNTTLATLAQHSFRETEVGAPNEVETGWITGEHLFDTRFSFEKNGYGPGGTMLVFALRMDTHRVPAEIKQAYRRMNEAAIAEASKSGFASRAEKKEAAETADRQMHEDLAAGKFRKSKIVHLIWDLSQKIVYCAVPSDKAVEQVMQHFSRSFNVELEAMTAGSIAGQLMRSAGKGRDYEDLRPSAFTKAPDRPAPDEDGEETRSGGGSIPAVPWTEASTDLKDFLGNEFLIWLWWVTEKQEGAVEIPTGILSGLGLEGGAGGEIGISIEKALDMDCAWDVTGKQTLRGGGVTAMPEAGEGLLRGKWPRKASLLLADVGDKLHWELTLQADKWIVSGAALPESPEVESPRELIESRLELTRELATTLDSLFAVFLKIRTGGGWPAKKTVLKQWISGRVKTRVAREE
jgi:hypothetical protein